MIKLQKLYFIVQSKSRKTDNRSVVEQNMQKKYKNSSSRKKSIERKVNRKRGGAGSIDHEVTLYLFRDKSAFSCSTKKSSALSRFSPLVVFSRPQADYILCFLCFFFVFFFVVTSACAANSSQSLSRICFKLGMCIHPNTRMILVKRGHAPGSSRGHLGLKTQKKIVILSLSG